MSELKNISILGAGVSGLGSALLGHHLGMRVFVSDNGSIDEKVKNSLDENGIEWEEEKHSIDRILNSDIIVKSPGIPGNIPMLQKATAQGIEVISEIEFAYRHCNGKIIGITGSNGKTTTTNLIHHILEKAGKSVCMVGNIGTSFAQSLTGKEYDYYVIELSSFQLEDVVQFRPDISIILNITPDHMDRYDNQLEKYAAAKFNITKNQASGDHFIYNSDDETVVAGMKNINKEVSKIPFSLKKKEPEGAYLDGDQFIINLNNKPFTMSIHELALQGKHNIYNSMAASIAGRILELRKDLIRDSLADFQNVEHRLEFVMKVHGISFVNDSKATNVNSTWYALESMTDRVVWIVGGVDKGNDYEPLKELVNDKVKAIVCLGKDNKKIHKAFGSLVENIEDAISAEEAVQKAYSLGSKGETVLLSPACASFDLFESFEDRGHQFKAAVRAL